LLPGVHGFPALSPDGHTVAVADPQDPDIAVWDLATGQRKGLARRHTAPVAYLAWSPDGSSFASAAEDALVVVWDASTLAPRLALAGHAGPVSSVSYSPDGRTVYTSGQDGMLLQWDVTGSRTLDRLVHEPRQPPDPVDPIGFDPRTRQFYFDVESDQDVMVHRVDADTGAEIGLPIRLDPDVNVKQLSPDGRYLTVSYADGGGQVFDAPSGRQLTGRVATSGMRARFAETDPTGRILAVAGRDADYTERLELFDTHTGQRTGQSLRLSANNSGLRFSPDGRYLLSGMYSGKVAVFDMRAHRLVTELAVYPQPRIANVLEFSPDGHLLVVGGEPGQLSAWRVGSWTRAWTANAVTNGPTGFISFSPDGQLVSTSGGKGKLLLFDATTGAEVGTPLSTNAMAVAFAPDGDSLLVLDGATGVHRWDVDSQSWVRRACSIAGRDLTSDEWQRYLPGRPQLTVCPANA
jgi:WD40 repeat protein